MHEAGALLGRRRILLLGDDDLISVAIAAFAAAVGVTAGIERLTVIDSDPDVLAWAADQISGTAIDAELVEHDLRRPLPSGLAGRFDVVCTDPPYTVAGAELFLSRAVSGLAPEPGKRVFFSFGARRPDETLRVQQLIGSMGLAVRALWPNFNEYLGAGILAGTSHLYYLRSTAAAAPLVEGNASGPLYTAEARATAARPYRCAGCRTVHEVGPGGRWPRIAALQQAGCPQCGGTVFRPMPLQERRGTETETGVAVHILPGLKAGIELLRRLEQQVRFAVHRPGSPVASPRSHGVPRRDVLGRVHISIPRCSPQATQAKRAWLLLLSAAMCPHALQRCEVNAD